MTIGNAISNIDELKPNNYSVEQKIGWLSELDMLVSMNVHSKYRDDESKDFKGYSADTPMETELLVSAPFDSIYSYYLQMKIDYFNEDYARYNNSSAMFQNQMNIYERWYNGTHIHKPSHVRYF